MPTESKLNLEMTSEHARLAATSPFRTAYELTERQRLVLRAVVEDYVTSAAPVGSKGLVARWGLAVSLAVSPGL